MLHSASCTTDRHSRSDRAEIGALTKTETVRLNEHTAMTTSVSLAVESLELGVTEVITGAR